MSFKKPYEKPEMLIQIPFTSDTGFSTPSPGDSSCCCCADADGDGNNDCGTCG